MKILLFHKISLVLNDLTWDTKYTKLSLEDLEKGYENVALHINIPNTCTAYFLTDLKGMVFFHRNSTTNFQKIAYNSPTFYTLNLIQVSKDVYMYFMYCWRAILQISKIVMNMQWLIAHIINIIKKIFLEFCFNVLNCSTHVCSLVQVLHGISKYKNQEHPCTTWSQKYDIFRIHIRNT